MPTPESPSFLAKKPKVPPTFKGVDYDDTFRLKQAQDAIVREQWVKSMMSRLVAEELGKCYVREGVNHLENCGRLRGMLIDLYAEKGAAEDSLTWLEIAQADWCTARYFEALKEARVTGYLFQQQNYVPGDE